MAIRIMKLGRALNEAAFLSEIIFVGFMIVYAMTGIVSGTGRENPLDRSHGLTTRNSRHPSRNPVFVGLWIEKSSTWMPGGLHLQIFVYTTHELKPDRRYAAVEE